jgi:signal transduction histidine kinase
LDFIFDVHAPTLLLATALTNLVAAILLVRGRRQLAGRDVLGPWAGFTAAQALANVGFAYGHGAIAALGDAPGAGLDNPGLRVLIVATPATTLLAFGLLWLGVRRITERGPPPWLVLLLPGVWAMATLIPSLRVSPSLAVALFLGMLLLLMGGAARDAWRAHGQHGSGTALDIALVLGAGCLYSVFRLGEAFSGLATPLPDSSALFTVVLGSALAFLGIAMAREAAARELTARAAAAAQGGRAEVERLLTGLPAVIFHREILADGTERLLFRAGDIEAVTGMDPASLAHHPNWTALAIPGTFDDREARRRTLSEGQFVQEWALRRPDGSVVWLRTEQRLLARRPGGDAEVVGYHLNITAEREAAAELDQTLTAVPAIVHRGLVSATGRYTRTWLSRGVEGVTGWPWESVNPPGGLQGLIHTDDQANTVEQMHAVLRDGRAEGEYRLLHADGHFIWVRSSMVVLERLPDGSAEVISFISDISAARAAREREAAALLAGREQVERLHAGLPAIIFLREVQPDGTARLLFRGGDVEAVTGWPEECLDASDGPFRTPGPDGTTPEADLQALLRRTLAEGVARSDWLLRQPDGTHRHIRTQTRVLGPAKGGATEVVGYLFDVTTERQAEARAAAASRLVSLGEMAAGLAHELRQPLAAISLAAEIAQLDARKQANAAVDRRLDVVVEQAQRASDIIELLRRFARGPEAGAAQVPLDLREVMVTLRALVAGALREAEVTLDISLGAPPPVPLGDRMALEQILTNLVMNARDAVVAHGGPRRVRITAAAEGDEVVLTISDTGGGLPPGVLARAFEPFVTTKGPDRGTGLGLSICYGLVRAMGGRIAVTNGEEGAVFSLALPAVARAQTVA